MATRNIVFELQVRGGGLERVIAACEVIAAAKVLRLAMDSYARQFGSPVLPRLRDVDELDAIMSGIIGECMVPVIVRKNGEACQPE